MISFRYAALAGLVAAAPAMAQDVSQLDYAPVSQIAGSNLSQVLVDSLLNDSGDNAVQFTIGYGFPGGSATPDSPDESRATRYTAIATFRVPPTRTTPFRLTDVRVGYRTSTVSGATSTPPRVQYDADAQPRVAVFRGQAPVLPVEDSTSAPGAVAQTTLPFTTRTVISPVDGYAAPAPELRRASLVPAGTTTLPASFSFQPGEYFTVRVQYFNVPFPQWTEAGSPTVVNTDSTSRGCQVGFPCTVLDLLRYNGPNVDDTVGADMFQDQWYIRALSDNAFFSSAGETGAENRAVALGQPFPNPARDIVELAFALRDAGTARLVVYDMMGRELAVVADQAFSSGGQTLTYDVSRLAAGSYVVALEANGERSTQRLSVVR